MDPVLAGTVQFNQYIWMHFLVLLWSHYRLAIHMIYSDIYMIKATIVAFDQI